MTLKKKNIIVNLKDIPICSYFPSECIKYWKYEDFVRKSGIKKVLINLQDFDSSGNHLLLEFIVTRKKVYYYNTRSIYDLSISEFESLMEKNKYIKYDLSDITWVSRIHIYRQLADFDIKFIPLEDCFYFISSEKFDGVEFLK